MRLCRAIVREITRNRVMTSARKVRKRNAAVAVATRSAGAIAAVVTNVAVAAVVAVVTNVAVVAAVAAVVAAKDALYANWFAMC